MTPLPERTDNCHKPPHSYIYVGSFGLGAEATDDVVQDVFLSLFRHLRLGRPQTNLKAWLFQVAHNLALKQRQKSSRRQQTEREWDSTLTERVIDPTRNPEQRLVDDQRRQQLLRILRVMPERDRQCVYLRAEGLGYREISGDWVAAYQRHFKTNLPIETHASTATEQRTDALDDELSYPVWRPDPTTALTLISFSPAP